MHYAVARLLPLTGDCICWQKYNYTFISDIVTPIVKSKPKVLIVESNPVQLNALSNIFKDISCEVMKATNGMEAFEIALKYRIDLIVSELFLPLMDGSSLVHEIRRLHYGQDAIFIFITDSISEETQIKCISDGADDVIIRPVNCRLIKSKFEGLLNRISESNIGTRSFLKRNLNVDLGKILLCKEKGSKFRLDGLHIEYLEVDNLQDFLKIYSEEHIWMVFIDEHATWAIAALPSIVHKIGREMPILLLASKRYSEEKCSQFMKNGGFGVISKFRAPHLLVHQINGLINRETNIKNQYINSIKQAVQTSPVHFAPTYEEDLKTFKIKIRYEPYTKPAGGDFYEIAKFPNGAALILLGDVMGKRWGAWFFANAYLAYIRASIRVFPTKRQFEIGNNLGFLVSEINQFLYKDIQLSDAFTTLTAILVQPMEQKIKISSAGAVPPILYRAAEKKATVLPVRGKILGIVEEELYTCSEFTYESGDKLVLLTDGYTEAVDAGSNKLIGIDRICSTLEMPMNKGITDLQRYEQAIAINNSVETFNDDRTMLLIDFK